MRKLAAVIVALAALVGCSSAPNQGPHTVIKVPESAAPSVPRVEPASVDIPKINAHSTLEPLGLDAHNALATPDLKRPLQAYYYCIVDQDPGKICSSGVLPGQPGPAVILAHIDGNKQKGLFHDLGRLTIGDTATVTLKDGTVLTFQTYKVLDPAKTEFPTQVVYQATNVPEVRFISCDGPFVGGSAGYKNNRIVFMALVPNPPRG
jgi:hypothetical protein